MPRFAPIDYGDGGYLPIRDHGLLGDGTTAALVGRDGAMTWLCIPRFDSPPVFCGILDSSRGGHFRIAPEDLVESRQYYVHETAVLVTELRGKSSLVRLTDALTLIPGVDLASETRAARHELLRQVEVLDGDVNLRVTVEPRGGGRLERHAASSRIVCRDFPGAELHLYSTIPLGSLDTKLKLGGGGRFYVALRWGGDPREWDHISPEDAMRSTKESWERWVTRFHYDGPQKPLVLRSAITLKLLDYLPNGAIVAAPTSSLPETMGGVRNWDYRYAWVRDAAFSVYALHRIGYSSEAASFLNWVLNSIERDGRPHVMYSLDGNPVTDEREDPDLEGYRQSRPVRWGNGAGLQKQHDVFGEILDCAYQYAAHHGSVNTQLWKKLSGLVEAASHEWRTPDHGIWEVRTEGRPFTYSAALCQVALDRGARMCDRFHLSGPGTRWREAGEHIRERILEEAWDPEQNALTEHLGGGGLDASLLSLPLRRVIPADHPRMLATTAAIEERLGLGGGLLYRYDVHNSPDGLEGEENAFLLCSFWLVDNFAMQGRVKEAADLYDRLCGKANPLGLLPEQIVASTGEFAGNFPQAFSHIGVISSGVNLSRAIGGR